MLFPNVVGKNLLKQEVKVPSQLAEEYNVVIIAFLQQHQSVVNTWVPFLEDLVKSHSGVEFYELPTIRRMNRIYQYIIDSGMRGGIPSPETRQRTITLYIDKKSFRDSLEIPDETEIHLYLIKRDGKVLWKERGEFTSEKANSLLKILNQTSNNSEQHSS